MKERREKERGEKKEKEGRKNLEKLLELPNYLVNSHLFF